MTTSSAGVLAPTQWVSLLPLLPWLRQNLPSPRMIRRALMILFFGNSIGMVIKYEKQNATFTSNLKPVQDLSKKEVWIRVAEVYAGTDHMDTGFQLGLTDTGGVTVWVDSNAVGSVPDPYPHPQKFKTMLKTLRFPAACFAQNRRFRINQVKAIKLRCNRAAPHPPLAFDDLQIVT